MSINKLHATKIYFEFEQFIGIRNVRERRLSIQDGGRRVLQIFLKIFRSPGDHRPKYFMVQ